jgi:nucleotide-binding universal stress UspA family protein
MVGREQRREIVVGVDGSPDSDRALAWALRTAAALERPVRFVHSEPRLLVDPLPPAVEERLANADRMLATALTTAAESFPQVRASSEVRQGLGLAPSAALVDLGRNAAMLVVGAQGHGGVSGLLIGSVSQHAARNAACPVVAVRAAADTRANRIVVGVDHSGDSLQALGLAYELAEALTVPLTVIHAWHYTSLAGPGSGMPLPSALVERQAQEQDELDQAMAPWREKYPDVPVTTEVVPGPPARILTDASEHAALVVVGSRGRSAILGLMLGSVSQAVLHHSRCPVVVAR